MLTWPDTTNRPDPSIMLTRVELNGEQIVARDAIELKTRELLAYSQEQGFTRLYLKGRRVVEVTEASQDIDRLVRAARSAALSAAA